MDAFKVYYFVADAGGRGGSGHPGGRGGGGVDVAAAPLKRPENYLQSHDDRSAGRIVPQGSDQRNEASRFGTFGCRRVLGHLRSVEAGMGAGRSGAGQSRFPPRTERHGQSLQQF